MYNIFISQEKRQRTTTKMYRKLIIENSFLLFVVISREYVGTETTQGTLTREHVSAQGTLALEHVSTQGTLAREHAKHVGT